MHALGQLCLHLGADDENQDAFPHDDEKVVIEERTKQEPTTQSRHRPPGQLVRPRQPRG